MIAAVLTSPGKIEIQNRKALSPAPLEAAVDVCAAGVCGTDLALYDGDYTVPLPLVPGHEFVGRVADVGSGVDPSLAGRRVTAEINNTCRSTGAEPLCEACAKGMDSHCLSRTVTGIIARDGAFAERVLVPAANLHVVPDGVSDLEAVFVEPVAAALQTFEMAPAIEGETVVVLGAGRLGYLIAGVARHLGARVFAAARSEEKCVRAREWLGIEAHRFESEEGLVRAVREWVGRAGGAADKGSRGGPERSGSEESGSGGSGSVCFSGAAHVVEATGSGDPAALALAARLVRPRGTIHLKSTPGAYAASAPGGAGFPMTDLVVNEVRLQGSRCGPFGKAIALIESRPFPVAELVAEEYPLREAAAALERAREVSKVVLRCAS